METQKLNREMFDRVHDNIVVDIVFGIDASVEEKRYSEEKWWPYAAMERDVMFADEFSPSNTKSQSYLLDFCNRLEDNKDIVFQKQVKCWIK